MGRKGLCCCGGFLTSSNHTPQQRCNFMKDPLEKIYNEIFKDALDYMEDYEVQAVAATYMAIAMRLYKTHLEDDAYKKMIENVMEPEVKPYNPKKVLH